MGRRRERREPSVVYWEALTELARAGGLSGRLYPAQPAVGTESARAEPGGGWFIPSSAFGKTIGPRSAVGFPRICLRPRSAQGARATFLCTCFPKPKRAWRNLGPEYFVGPQRLRAYPAPFAEKAFLKGHE